MTCQTPLNCWAVDQGFGPCRYSVDYFDFQPAWDSLAGNDQPRRNSSILRVFQFLLPRDLCLWGVPGRGRAASSFGFLGRARGLGPVRESAASFLFHDL